jgi:hypothetical protein
MSPTIPLLYSVGHTNQPNTMWEGTVPECDARDGGVIGAILQAGYPESLEDLPFEGFYSDTGITLTGSCLFICVEG